MTARERYYLNRHLHRLLLWQIERAEIEQRNRKARLREFKSNWRFMLVRRAVRVIEADNARMFARIFSHS